MTTLGLVMCVELVPFIIDLEHLTKLSKMLSQQHFTSGLTDLSLADPTPSHNEDQWIESLLDPEAFIRKSDSCEGVSREDSS